MRSHRGPGGSHPRAGDLALGPVASALGPADKVAILRDLRGRADLAAFGPRAREASFAEVAAALRADPFEADALERTLEDQLARIRQAEEAVRSAVVTHVAAMSPADRVRLRRPARAGGPARTGPGLTGRTTRRVRQRSARRGRGGSRSRRRTRHRPAATAGSPRSRPAARPRARRGCGPCRERWSRGRPARRSRESRS